MKVALFVLLFGWQCVVAGDGAAPNEFAPNEFVPGVPVPDKSVRVGDQQATADELYEQGQSMVKNLIEKRDQLYEQLRLLVEALEKKGVDGALMVDDTYQGLYERGLKALQHIFQETDSLEKRVGVLQHEMQKVDTEEKEFQGMIEKLEKIIDEVAGLAKEKKLKERSYFKVRKFFLLSTLAIGGISTVVILLAAMAGGE